MAGTTRGRRSKLTPERFNGLVADIRNGCYAEVAARRAGISEKTYYTWLQKGESGQEPFTKLLQSIRAAEAEAEAKAVARIYAASRTDWKAAAFFLERKFQKRWGRHDRSDVTVTTHLEEEIEQRLLRGRQRNAEGK